MVVDVQFWDEEHQVVIGSLAYDHPATIPCGGDWFVVPPDGHRPESKFQVRARFFYLAADGRVVRARLFCGALRALD
jgi:hypothetical protein